MEERFIEHPRSASGPRHLTPRHREMLQMLAEGRSPKEIASILNISIRTVFFHKYEIMKELAPVYELFDKSACDPRQSRA